jgi:hypothetical protein
MRCVCQGRFGSNWRQFCQQLVSVFRNGTFLNCKNGRSHAIHSSSRHNRELAIKC